VLANAPHVQLAAIGVKPTSKINDVTPLLTEAESDAE
jgi:hypothetical protein